MWIVLLLAMFLPSIVNAQTCAKADLNHPLMVTAAWKKNAADNIGARRARRANRRGDARPC